MNQIIELWKRKSDPQGRINLTVFFINLFLFMCHIFLMVVYVMVGHKIMYLCFFVINILIDIWALLFLKFGFIKYLQFFHSDGDHVFKTGALV